MKSFHQKTKKNDENQPNKPKYRIENNQIIIKLDNHLKKNVHEPKYHVKCKVCSQVCPSEDELRKHMAFHICKICQLNFKAKCDLRSHIRICHEIIRAMSCKLCKKEFSYLSGFKRHMLFVIPRKINFRNRRNEGP